LRHILIFQGPAIKNLLRRIQQAPDNELPSALALSEWSLPKADLYHFIPVLNRFDQLLESIIQQHDFTLTIQRVPFSSETKHLLLSILRFTRFLIENATNRGIFNSHEVIYL
jgi:E3 ubiquitin-protein ligase HUWE1